ncbi:H-NS family nucleoid-associated regulatory protein [Burkholderia gladioli]
MDIQGWQIVTQPSQKARAGFPSRSDTWTGRGKAPAWLAGKDRSAFEI